MVSRFPASESSSVGKFWLAKDSVEPDDNVKSGGACRIEDGQVEVDVAGEFTTGMIEVSSGVSVQQPESKSFDVHGSIPIAPWYVSFLDCVTKSRRRNGLSLFTKESVPRHLVRGVWAVVGAHVVAGDRYQGVRVRLSGLEEWARTPGLEQTITKGESLGSAVVFSAQPQVVTPFGLFGESGSLVVDTVANMDAIDVHGGQIRRWNRIGLTDLGGWTLEETFLFFVLPMKTLMTLLSGQEAKVLSVEVQMEDQWFEVFGRYVDGGARDAKPGTVPMMLGADVFTLERVVTWLAVVHQLSPVPNVVAAAIAGEFTTVDTRALVMATSVESIDRRLRPDHREFDAHVIVEALEVLRETAIDDGLQKKLLDAVDTYMHEPSMAKRVAELAENVARVAPDCVGRTNRWKQAVTGMRIRGAHGLADEGAASPGLNSPHGELDAAQGAEPARNKAGPDTDANELVRLHTLALSVQWALRIRVLQACGVPDEDLTAALGTFDEYTQNRYVWRNYWPRIFDGF
ncbi:hypothetical protein EUA93_04715 [Nocardioides oleivorans]|uniref:ApeA N-terminal domain-containing protein n=1 Tax=Nocardioides oleivorans TaxID=273676 RepID=A0A4Q2S0D1_9ACTN|nr:hypothetical protein [Nocardioides oleivorans]RYB93719.1 hypothetical protein EUA93_04715 [Nocardioides oleivorans]